MSTEPTISIAAAARQLGISKQTLHRQVKAGLVRRHADGVRLSEVIADRKRNLDPSAATRHRRERRQAAKPPADANSVPSINIPALVAWLADQTFASFAGSKGKGRVRLDHLRVTVSRADADELLGAYRSGDTAAIGVLHRRLAPNA